MKTEDIEYRDADGNHFISCLCEPDRPNGAAVVIAPGAPGVSVHEREVARRLAELGYVALAADYHGIGGSSEGALIGARMEQLLADPTFVRDALERAVATVRAHPA